MVLVIDNYDSFTYNLVQYLGMLGQEVTIARNDEISLDEIESQAPMHIVISPGPGEPTGAGISLDVIRRFATTTPILGVCLGHQCIAHAFGGEVVHADRLMHGKTSRVYHNGNSIYQGLPNPFVATRYHSLAVREESLPTTLHVTAYTSNGEVMGIQHESLKVVGVQFHPESILTKHGQQLLANFLNGRKS